MTDTVLIIAILSVFLFGYFLMVKLDKFLVENRKAIEKENEKKEPSCVMLTENLSEKEIVEEIQRFRNNHEGARVILYDSTDKEF